MAKFFTQNYHRLSMLLTTLACMLWSVTLFRLASTGLAADDMGYIHTLPATFWVAIVLLTIASGLLWSAAREHTALLGLQLCLFIAMAWLTPLFVGISISGTRYSFMVSNLTQYILRYGHLDNTSQWYHNWPAFNLTETALLQLSGITDVDAFIIWAQSPMQFIIALSLCALFRRNLGTGNRWAAAVWFFVLFNWTAQTYYSPQGMGIILLLTFFFLLTIKITEDISVASIRLLGILVIAGLVITHMLTALAGLFVITSFGALAMFKKRWFHSLTVLFIVFFFGWLVFYAGVFFRVNLSNFLEQVFDFELMWFRNVTRAQLGSEGHFVVVNTKIWLTIVAGVIALSGLALSRKIKAQGDSLVLLIGIGVFMMLPFQFYGNEFLSRLFIYILPVLAYFAAKLVMSKTGVLLLSLTFLVVLPFGIIGLHGNAMVDSVTHGQIAYWNFLRDKTERGALGLGGVTGAWTFGYANRYVAGFNWISIYGSKWPERLAIRGWVTPGMPNYLTFGGFEDAGFKLWTDFPEGVKELTSQADGLDDLTRFYHNGNEAISYYHDGVVLQYYPPLE